MEAASPRTSVPSKRIGARSRLRRLLLAPVAALLLLFVAVTATPAAASTYTMTDLGSLGLGVSMGFGINAGGEVVGRSYLKEEVPTTGCPPRHKCTTHPAHAFSWSAGAMTDLLGSQGGLFSEATAVNRGGEIVGRTKGGAFLFHNGQMTLLGGTAASGINDLGEVVGNGGGSTGGSHVFLFSGGRLTVLPDLSSYGGGLSGATAINNNHQVVGGSDNAEGWGHAVLWSNGKIQDLGTLGGTQSAAYAINDLGRVVGWAHTVSEATHVFLFSAGKMHDLGTFGLDPVALAINNHSVIVGISGRGAFVWSNGAFQELNALIPPGSGFVLTEATAINDAGQIVANGYSSTNYQHHAFLLTPH